MSLGQIQTMAHTIVPTKIVLKTKLAGKIVIVHSNEDSGQLLKEAAGSTAKHGL